MARHCENGRAVVAYLKTNNQVEKIYWPGLEIHPGHDIASRQMSDFGGMVAFTLKGDSLASANKFVESTKIFTLAESLGGVESLIGHPASMTHASIPKEIREKVYSSGEAALNYLRKNSLEEKFYHVGPPRDFDLFLDFKKNKTNDIKESSYLLCTGLFEEQGVNLNYYKELFKDHINKKMICTNPDLIVDRGEKRELCAGSVALVFEKMGGEVIYFGKPFPKVYNQAINNEGKRVLSIGDNLNTDIKGANLLNYDSLIISNGVHRDEIKKEGIDVISKKYEVVVNFIQTELKW